MNNLTPKEILYLNNLNTRTKTMSFGAKIQAIIAGLNGVSGLNTIATEGTPVNAVNAKETLTVSGVVIDGETVTINNPAVTGTDVYEFLADTAQTKTTATNIAVNITASTTKATGTLTVAVQPTSGDKMTIGTKVYTFVPDGTANADDEISIGTSLSTAQANIVAAINGTDPLVSASDFAVNVSTITALVGGVAGNSIATTEVFTSESNVFGAVTLESGADCSAANAITALVAAVTTSDTQGVGAVDGDGDTVVLTADTAGVIGNAIVIGETMAHGAFTEDATLLSGGVNGTVGAARSVLMDASYLYVCVATNTISGKNWRRVSLGSAY